MPNNYKKWPLFFIFFALFLQNVLSGQDLVSLEDKRLKIAGFDYYVTEVIDARPSRYCIGFIKKGIANQKTVAFMEKGLELEMLGLFQRSFSKTSAAKPIVVQVNLLEIYELTTSVEVSGLRIHISFLEKEGNRYIELFNVGTLIEKNAIVDATKSHDGNIVKGLEYCCNTFVQRKRDGLTWSRDIDAGNGADSRTSDYAVFKVEKPAKGIYLTFEDFRDNTPNTTPEFSLEKMQENKNGQFVCKGTWANGTPFDELDNFWGLSDGEFWYIRAGKHYYRLHREGKAFSIQLKTVNKNVKVGWYLVGGAAGGLIGGMIVVGINATIQAANSEVEPYCINFATSALEPQGYAPKISPESKVLFYCERNAEMPPDIPFFMGDKNMGDLQQGQALVVHLPVPVEAVVARIGTAEMQTAKTLVLENFETQYYKVVYRNNQFQMVKMEEKFLETMNYEIEKNNIVLVDKGY